MTKDNTETEVLPAKTLNYKLLAGVEHLEGAAVKAHMKKLSADNTVIADIVGEVSSYVVKPGKFGDDVAFIGDFVAVSCITGKQFSTSKFYFDKSFSEQVRAQFDKRTEGAPVRFSCRITVVHSTRGSDGFTYVASPLRTPEVVNRQKELLGILSSASRPQLIESKDKKKA